MDLVNYTRQLFIHPYVQNIKKKKKNWYSLFYSEYDRKSLRPRRIVFIYRPKPECSVNKILKQITLPFSPRVRKERNATGRRRWIRWNVYDRRPCRRGNISGQCRASSPCRSRSCRARARPGRPSARHRCRLTVRNTTRLTNRRRSTRPVPPSSNRATDGRRTVLSAVPIDMTQRPWCRFTYLPVTFQKPPPR